MLAVSQLWQAGQAANVEVHEVDQVALFFVLSRPNLRNARQLREFAAQAVARIPRGDDRVLYDHLFRPGDPLNKRFWSDAEGVCRPLVGEFVAIRG